MTATDGIRLAQGDVACVVSPAFGGSILSLTVAGRHLLRPTADGVHDPLQMASFPLLPFANRIGGGRFTFEGVEAAVPPHPIALPHALHGHGWITPWTVAAQDGARLELVYDHPADGWPWPYRARQNIALTDRGIHLSIAIDNRDQARAMPVGVGIHPYFRRYADSHLIAHATHCWHNDVTSLAVEQRPDDRFAAGERVAIATMEGSDNYFTGGTGPLIVEDGEGRTRIAMDGAGGFHLYVPIGESHFCVEPVSHAPNSFGRGEFRPQDIIAPGEERQWNWTIDAID